MKHIQLYEAFQEEEEVFPSKGKAYHVTPDVYINLIKIAEASEVEKLV